VVRVITRPLDSGLQATYQADATANVAWALFGSALSGFAMVVARKAGGGAGLMAFGMMCNYVPGIMAWLTMLLARRFPLGSVIVGLRALACLGMLPCVIAPSLTTLTLGYFLVYTLGGMADAAYPTLLHAIYPRDAHTRVMSTVFGLRTLAGFLLLLALGGIMNHLSEAAAIRLLGSMAVLGVVSVAATWRFRGVRDVHPDAPEPETGHPLANREFVRYLTSLTVYGVGIVFAGVVWPMLQVDRDAFNLSYSQVGVLAGASALTLTVTYLIFSRYGVVRASNRLLALPYVLIAQYIVAAWVLLRVGLHGTAAFPWLLAGVAVTNIGAGLQGIYFHLVVNALAGGRSPLRYQATQGVIVGTRGIVAGILAWLLCQRVGLPTTAAIAAVLMLLGGALAWLSPGGAVEKAGASSQRTPT
jgi:hypothetical protein